MAVQMRSSASPTVVRLLLVVAAVGLGTGCAHDFVGYGTGRVEYSGSRIEYLEATPSPGAVVIQGTPVEFKVRVRYSLQRADKGRLIVWFTDRHDAPLAVDTIAIPIQRTVSAVDTVTRQIVIPTTYRDLILHVGVAAGTETFTAGDVQVTYLVNRAK
jgi:hypothetical protein